jgi:hypothetical protein
VKAYRGWLARLAIVLRFAQRKYLPKMHRHDFSYLIVVRPEVPLFTRQAVMLGDEYYGTEE